MGLFVSLAPEQGFAGKRFLKKDVTTPTRVHLTLMPGTITSEQDLLSNSRNILATSQCQWCFLGPNVTRHPILHERIKGTLFIHARSPYSTHDFIDHLLALPIQLHRLQCDLQRPGQNQRPIRWDRPRNNARWEHHRGGRSRSR